jgi:hypothetical protein
LWSFPRNHARSAVLRAPSWSGGGTTCATRSTAAGATPSTTTCVLAPTLSTVCCFSGELLSNPAIFFSRSDLEWLHINAENLVHSFLSMWPLVVRHHMSCVRPSSREKNFFVWPDLRVVTFLAGFENLTMQGRCCRNF